MVKSYENRFNIYFLKRFYVFLQNLIIKTRNTFKKSHKTCRFPNILIVVYQLIKQTIGECDRNLQQGNSIDTRGTKIGIGHGVVYNIVNI